MSLLFGNASSDRIQCGTSSTTANLTAATYLFWIYPTIESGTVRRLHQRGLFNGTGGRSIEWGSGHLSCQVERTGTGALATASQANLVDFSVYGINKWLFVAATHDTNGVATSQVLYMGDLATNAAEPSAYGIQQIGTGTVTSNTTSAQILFNNSNINISFIGRAGMVHFYNRVLSYAEIVEQQWRPHRTAGSVLFMYPGFNGTGTQADWSGNGNAGTVTGATLADGLPINVLFGRAGIAPHRVVVGSVPTSQPSLVEAYSPRAGQVAMRATQGSTNATFERFYWAPNVGGSANAAAKVQLSDVAAPGVGTSTTYRTETGFTEGASIFIGASELSTGGESSITWAATPVVVHSVPTIAITTPSGGSVSSGTTVLLQCTASDADGAVTVAWSSSIMGGLGSGASVPFSGTDGTHVITAVATDADGDTASAQITMTFGVGAPAAGGRQTMDPEELPYGVAVTFPSRTIFTGTAAYVGALVAGDVKISKDGGALANIATLPTLAANGKKWVVTLSAAEMSAKTVDVFYLAGSDIPFLTINTYGNTSAFYTDTMVATDSSGRVTSLSVVNPVNVGGYAAGQDPATLTQSVAIKAKTDLIPAGGPPSAADWTPTRAGKVDNLDAAVSTRAAAVDWTAARAAKVDNLDAAISTRATPANVTAAQTAITTAIAALNNLSQAQAQAAAEAGLAAYDAATGADVAAVSTGGLSQATLEAAATNAITAYGTAKASDVSTTQTALTNLINALNDLSALEVQNAADAALVAKGLSAAVVTALKKAAILGGGGGRISRANSAAPFTVVDLDNATSIGSTSVTKDSAGEILSITAS